jgi:single-strand DNA-binding protein
MKDLRNRVHLIGNLGMDPEVKEFENGRKLAKFSLATSQSYRNAEGKQVEDTQWHSLIAWGNLATIAEKYLHKGREVAVEGKLIYRTYEDKQGGTRYVTEIVLSDILMFQQKKQA